MNDPVEQGFFTEENSAEVVISRNARCTEPASEEVMAVLVRHLHAAIKEIEPTQEEWFAAIRFLTETGHKSDDWRQEFILLSDTLGVSMLVDAINHRSRSGATESTVLGPFHVAGAPELPNGADICLDQKGEPMVVRGRVTDLAPGNRSPARSSTSGRPTTRASTTCSRRACSPTSTSAACSATDADGTYWFRAVKPKFYPIPDDGPVGQLLRRLGRHPYRPAHLHYIVEADGLRADSPPTSSFRMIPTSTATRYSA